MKKYSIIALSFLVVCGMGMWWFSPTQVIKRRTNALLRTLSFELGSGTAGRQMGGYSLNALLASEVELENATIKEANGHFERSELESAYSWLAGQAKETRFEIEKIHSISVADEHALIDLTLSGLVVLPSYRPADGHYEVTFDWVKEKGGWRLDRAVWKEAK